MRVVHVVYVMHLMHLVHAMCPCIARIRVCAYVCMRTCMCMYARVFAMHARVRAHMYVRRCVHAWPEYMHACMHACVYARVCDSCVHGWCISGMYARLVGCVHGCMHASMHAFGVIIYVCYVAWCVFIGCGVMRRERDVTYCDAIWFDAM